MSEQNGDIQTAWRFHDATKYTRVAAAEGESQMLMGTPPILGPAMGEQDPALEPFPYKIYTSLDPIPLPRDPLTTTLSALDALAATGELSGQGAMPNLATL